MDPLEKVWAKVESGEFINEMTVWDTVESFTQVKKNGADLVSIVEFL